MRFKQRLKVIQSLEDTAKRSVVGVVIVLQILVLTRAQFTGVFLFVQVRAMMTESAFSIEELEDLYCLFKVRTSSLSIRCVHMTLLSSMFDRLCPGSVQTHDQLLLGLQQLSG